MNLVIKQSVHIQKTTTLKCKPKKIHFKINLYTVNKIFQRTFNILFQKTGLNSSKHLI